MMPRAAALSLGVLLLAGHVSAQKAVFVVRHAEKVSEEDERLSDAGRQRAERLARMLADAGVAALYATATERAQDTAKPLAKRLNLPVRTYELKREGAKLDARPLAERLESDHPKDVVLVIGHSNTVPELLRALGCRQEIRLEPGDYDNLFVVVPQTPGRPATLLRLRY